MKALKKKAYQVRLTEKQHAFAITHTKRVSAAIVALIDSLAAEEQTSIALQIEREAITVGDAVMMAMQYGGIMQAKASILMYHFADKSTLRIENNAFKSI